MQVTQPKSLYTQPRSVLRFITTPRVILPALALLSLLLYGPSLSSWGAADDLNHLRAALSRTIPLRIFFRPIEWTVNRLDVAWLGYQNLVLSRWFNLLGFWVTIACVYLLGKAVWSRSTLPAVFAALLLVLSSQSTLTVIQIDTISQQYATVFALLFLLSLLGAVERKSLWLYLLAYVFAFFALIAKETAPGIVAAIPLAVGLISWQKGVYTQRRQMFKALLVNYLAVAFVAALYAGLRTGLGYSFSDNNDGGSSRYELALSVGRLGRNLVLYAANLLYSGGSTLDIFPQLKMWRVVVASALSAVLLIGVLVTTFRLLSTKSAKILSLLSLFLLVLAGSFPVILTYQVSELYVYSSLPFFALLLGICFYESVLLLAGRFHAQKVYYVVAIFSLCFFSWLGFGTYEKVSLIRQTNAQSWQYFSQALTLFNTAADETTLCWPETQSSTPTYSTIVMDPRHVANRAIGLAAFVDNQTFYLFSGNKLLRTSKEPSAVRHELKNRSPVCNYQLGLDTRGLQFAQQ